MWLVVRILILLVCLAIIPNRANPVDEINQTVESVNYVSDTRDTNYPNESILTSPANNVINAQEYQINDGDPNLTNLSSNIGNVDLPYDPTLGNLDPKFLSQYVQSALSGNDVPLPFESDEKTSQMLGFGGVQQAPELDMAQAFRLGNIQMDQQPEMLYQNNPYNMETDQIPVFDINKGMEIGQIPQFVSQDDSLTNDELARFNKLAQNIENIPLSMNGVSPELEKRLSMKPTTIPDNQQPLYSESIPLEGNVPEQLTNTSYNNRIPSLLKPLTNLPNLNLSETLPINTSKLLNFNPTSPMLNIPGFGSFSNSNNEQTKPNLNQSLTNQPSNFLSSINPWQNASKFSSLFKPNDQLAQATNAMNSDMDQITGSTSELNPSRKNFQLQQSMSAVPTDLPITQNEPANFFNFDSPLTNQFGFNQFRQPNLPNLPSLSDNNFPLPWCKRRNIFQCKKKLHRLINQLNPTDVMRLLTSLQNKNLNNPTSPSSISNLPPRVRRSPNTITLDGSLDTGIDTTTSSSESDSESIESIESETDSYADRLKSWAANMKTRISARLNNFKLPFFQNESNEFDGLISNINSDIDALNTSPTDYLPSRDRRSPDTDSDYSVSSSSESDESNEYDVDSYADRLKSWADDIKAKMPVGFNGFRLSQKESNELNGLTSNIYDNMDALVTSPFADYPFRARRSSDVSASDSESVSESIESIESETDSYANKLKSWATDMKTKISAGLNGFQFSEKENNQFNDLTSNIYGNIDELNPHSGYLPSFNDARSDKTYLDELWKMLTDETYRTIELRKQSLKEINEARKELTAALQYMANGESYTDEFGRVKMHIDKAIDLFVESCPIYRALTYCKQNYPQQLPTVADVCQKILAYSSK